MKNTIIVCITILLATAMLGFALIYSASFDRYEHIDNQRVFDKKECILYFRTVSDYFYKPYAQL